MTRKDKRKYIVMSGRNNIGGLITKPLSQISLVILLGLLVYSNTFTAPFLFDDHIYIVQNQDIKDLSHLWPPTETRWFGSLTFALNYQIHGLHVTGYHVVNVAIHIINAILVYLLVVLTFRTPFLAAQGDRINYRLIAFISSLLFVSHPIQTQAVTYIAQRFTSLATMLYLLTLVCYITFRISTVRVERYTLYAVALVSAILAMKTKEICFTLPFMIIIYEFCFFDHFNPISEPLSPRTGNRVRFLRLLPFLVTLIIIPLSLLGQEFGLSASGEGIDEGIRRSKLLEATSLSSSDYLITQFRVIITYIRLLIFPFNQKLIYDYPLFNSFFSPEVFGSFLSLLLLFSAAVYLFYKSRNGYPLLRLPAFGILWFFVALSVESSMIPIKDIIFEHRVYLPSIGAFIAITSFIFIIANSPGHVRPWVEKFVCSVFVFVSLLYATGAYARNRVWQDEIRFWEDVTAKNTTEVGGYINLGHAYLSRGFIEKSIETFRTVVTLQPDNADAHLNLGLSYYSKGDYDQALNYYLIAQRLDPNSALIENALGAAYDSQGLTTLAIEHYRTALRLDPKKSEVYTNLGIVFYSQGKIQDAIKEYNKALALDPDSVEAHYNLAISLSAEGLSREAIEQFRESIRLNPDFAKAHYYVSLEYRKAGLSAEAEEHLRQATALK